MNELKIKQMTAEEFQLKYNLQKEDITNSYSVSELSCIMANVKTETTYILIEDRLYEAPTVDDEKIKDELLFGQHIIEKIEALNESFRDALIGLRECMYHGQANPAQEKAMRLRMNQYINEAKEILNQHDIKDRETLTKNSKKYFTIEFLDGLFGDETYNSEIEIDCGL